METNRIARLRRMRDYDTQGFEVIHRISSGISMTLDARGFQPLDTPLLERTDLFVRKSGGAIAGSLYTFTDPGGIDVSLRPEFTPSVIRWYIENVRAPEPRKFRYAGPVFRYGENGNAPRQYTQCGGEMLGTRSGEGDRQILRTAAECISDSGVGEYAVRIGHVGIVRDLALAQGLSEPLQMFIMSNLDGLASGRDGMDRLTDRATAAGLVGAGGRETPAPLGPMSNGDAIAALQSLGNSLPGPTGRRAPERIMERLASRMRQAASESEFRAALSNVSALISERAEFDGARVAPDDPLREIERVMRSCGASLDSLDELRSTLERVMPLPADAVPIEIDLSFARGLAYYTGIVFEFADRHGNALGGGGRYDDLVRAFGGADTVACGFALNVDALAEAAR